MEKVVLTKEQAEFVEKYKAVRGLAEKLGKAVSEGYEVEEEFKVGDKVICIDSKIMKIDKVFDSILAFQGGGYLYEKDVCRLATKEEIYWLETLGRKEVGLFKYTDVFIDGDGDAHLLNGVHPSDGRRSLEDAEYWYEMGFFKGIYPAESFKRYPQEAE